VGGHLPKTSSLQRCAVVARRTRIQGSNAFASLSSRLESHKKEEDETPTQVVYVLKFFLREMGYITCPSCHARVFEVVRKNRPCPDTVSTFENHCLAGGSTLGDPFRLLATPSKLAWWISTVERTFQIQVWASVKFEWLPASLQRPPPERGLAPVVSGFGSRVSSFGYRVSGFRFRFSGLGFQVSGL
jgi:hypothetical protein